MDSAGSLHWDIKGFRQLLDAQLLVDCTLCCDGGKISAHKIVLSACSSYLAKILADHPVEHPIIILPELEVEDVRTLVYYMYTGELLKSSTTHSSSLLRTAAILSVNSLQDLLAGAQAQLEAANQQEVTNKRQHLHSNLNHLSQQLGSSGGATSAVNSSHNYSLLLAAHKQGPSSTNTSLASSSSTSPISLLGHHHYTSSTATNCTSSTTTTTTTTATTTTTSTSTTSTTNSSNMTAKHMAAGLSLEPQAGSSMVVGKPQQQQQQVERPAKSDFQFKCPVCQNDFQTICSFEYHMQRIHNVTSFGCEICHRPFASLRYVLTDHMRRCHPDSIM